MRFLHEVAGFILFFELPIPIYWLIIHPFNSFWRNRICAAFWVAGLTAWTSGGVLLWIYRPLLLSAAQPSWVAIAAGLRSEEHTSELQSRSDLVCRLLLENK